MDRSGVTASTCGNSNQTVGAFADRTFGKAVVDNVVQNDTTPAVHLVIHPLLGAE